MPEKFWLEAEVRGLIPPPRPGSPLGVQFPQNRLEAVAEELSHRDEIAVSLHCGSLEAFLDRIALHAGRVAVIASDDFPAALPEFPSIADCLKPVQLYLETQETRAAAHLASAPVWANLLELLQKRREVDRELSTVRAGLRDRKHVRDQLERSDHPPDSLREVNAELAGLTASLVTAESALATSKTSAETSRFECDRLRRLRPWHIGYWQGARGRLRELDRATAECVRECERSASEAARLQSLMKPAEERRSAILETWIDEECTRENDRIENESIRIQGRIEDLRNETEITWRGIAQAGEATPDSIEEARERQVQAGIRAETCATEAAWAREWMQKSTALDDILLQRCTAGAPCWRIPRTNRMPRFQGIFDLVLHAEAFQGRMMIRKGGPIADADRAFLAPEPQGTVVRMESIAAPDHYEPLIGEPGIQLGFLGDGRLAEVRFPADTATLFIKAFLADHLDLRTLAPVGDRYRVQAFERRIVLRFRESAEPVCFAWGGGICEMLDGAETVAVAFAEADGWTAEKARAWIEPRLESARETRFLALD